MLKASSMKKTGITLSAVVLFLVSHAAVYAADEMDMKDMDMHAHHHHHEMSMETKRSEVNLVLPDVQMVRQDGEKVNFSAELQDGRVAVLSFIYTTCTAVCPMTSQTIFKLQGKLGGDLDKVHLVSVSIDPEQDTPERLAAYAKKYHASKLWDHYTGTEEASVTIQKAMGAYRGDKMNHQPVTFIRRPNNGSWVRIDGFATADDLLHEVQSLLEKH